MGSRRFCILVALSLLFVCQGILLLERTRTQADSQRSSPEPDSPNTPISVDTAVNHRSALPSTASQTIATEDIKTGSNDRYRVALLTPAWVDTIRESATQRARVDQSDKVCLFVPVYDRFVFPFMLLERLVSRSLLSESRESVGRVVFALGHRNHSDLNQWFTALNNRRLWVPGRGTVAGSWRGRRIVDVMPFDVTFVNDVENNDNIILLRRYVTSLAACSSAPEEDEEKRDANIPINPLNTKWLTVYGTNRRALMIPSNLHKKFKTYNHFLGFDDDVNPRSKSISTLFQRYKEDPVQLYGYVHRGCYESGYISGPNVERPNVVLTPFLMTHRNVFEAVVSTIFELSAIEKGQALTDADADKPVSLSEGRVKFFREVAEKVISFRGNGEDLLLNAIFKARFPHKKGPIFVKHAREEQPDFEVFPERQEHTCFHCNWTDHMVKRHEMCSLLGLGN